MIYAAVSEGFIKKLPISIRNAAPITVRYRHNKEVFCNGAKQIALGNHRQTAAEIISSRTDSGKENMGLTTWKNAPKGNIRKTDVGIAKNYLNETELNGLNRIVTMYLDDAENQAGKGAVMYMKDWIKKLDAFFCNLMKKPF